MKAGLLNTGLVIAENALVYTFLKRLIDAKCECSQDWRREALTSMTVVNFILAIINMYVGDQIKPDSYLIFLTLYSALYFSIVLSYTHKLHKLNCVCADGIDHDYIYYSRAIIVLMSLVFFTIGSFLS
jgi:hypothetical protein